MTVRRTQREERRLGPSGVGIEIEGDLERVFDAVADIGIDDFEVAVGNGAAGGIDARPCVHLHPRRDIAAPIVTRMHQGLYVNHV